MNKQKINTIDNNNKNCIKCEVSYWNTKNCKVYHTQGFYRMIFFVEKNCMTLWLNMKQRCQFLGNIATNFDAVASRSIVSSQGATSANFLRHYRLLAQLQAKLRVTCRRCQIDTITNETSQPLMGGEAIPNPVWDAPFAGHLTSHRGLRGVICTIAVINSINLDYGDWISYIAFNELNEQ